MSEWTLKLIAENKKTKAQFLDPPIAPMAILFCFHSS